MTEEGGTNSPTGMHLGEMVPQPHQSKIKDFCQLLHYGMIATGNHCNANFLRAHRPKGKPWALPRRYRKNDTERYPMVHRFSPYRARIACGRCPPKPNLSRGRIPWCIKMWETFRSLPFRQHNFPGRDRMAVSWKKGVVYQ